MVALTKQQIQCGDTFRKRPESEIVTISLVYQKCPKQAALSMEGPTCLAHR